MSKHKIVEFLTCNFVHVKCLIKIVLLLSPLFSQVRYERSFHSAAMKKFSQVNYEIFFTVHLRKSFHSAAMKKFSQVNYEIIFT